MKIKYLFLFLLISVLTVSSCKKKETFDAAKQAKADEQIIEDFIAKNHIPAIKHSNGIYYQIINAGSGDIAYTDNTTVTANYTGRLIDGTVFDKTTTTPIAFKLGGVIEGWRIGVPLIQKGGKIRLLIPSAHGYRQYGKGPVPGNAVLDFDIELVDVNN